MKIDSASAVIIFAVVFAVGALIIAFVWAKTSSSRRTSIALSDVQQRGSRIRLIRIEGTGSNLGMIVYIRNGNDFVVRVLSPPGVVIEPDNSDMQQMITVRSQVFEVASRVVGRFEVNAICLESFKIPPNSRGDGNYRVREITENAKILKLFRTVGKLEQEISKKILAVDGLSFQAKPMSAELLELSRHCRFTRRKRGKFEARISDHAVQCALWQITDELDLDKFARVVRAFTAESRADLRRVVEVANIILREAKIKPTIVM